jgi:catechol 2,3-dioxygenase-like lactoylglutathione lyase family enzyme
VPHHVNLVVRDIARSVEFYRLLGWEAEVQGPHASIRFGHFDIELDEYEFAVQWNRGKPTPAGGSGVLCVTVPERSSVDSLLRTVVAAGHPVVQKPYDAFWGSRFAVVADPDGYQIGLMSPIEVDRKFWPPSQPPA